MKKSFFVLLVVLGCWSVNAADDMADAKAAFETLQAYQKTDDIRALDLFATNCIIRLKTINDLEEKTMFIEPAAFREILKDSIAKKEGNLDKYEDVEFSADGFSVKVTAAVIHVGTVKPGSFIASYERDGKGVLKIQELKITTYVAKPDTKAADAK